jgi:purine-cytosine permease-like protein
MDNTNNAARDDFATTAVPLDSRYSPVSMGLLWITMVSGFPAVLIGFAWQKAGFSLVQIISGAFISCLILLAYVLTASQLGATTGLNFALLTRSVFGTRGSQIISALQTFLFLVWYALIAGFVAVEIKDLFPMHYSIQLIAAIAAILMAANNLFGFAGVANFAKYVAAPILILWIFSLFIKTASMTPVSVWAEPGTGSFGTSLSVISSFVIGYSVWGNEPDFWRFAKPNLLTTSVPLVTTIFVGQMIFPVCGWMLSRIVHVADISTATGAVTDFSFGSAPLLAAAVLTASYFAAGDANLYGAINSIENLHNFNRTRLVLSMMGFTAVIALLLAYYGKAFEVLSSFNSILLPCVTIILSAEYFLLRRLKHVHEDLAGDGSLEGGERSPGGGRSDICRIAIIALAFGWIVGILTAGVIHGTEYLHVGVWPLYAWLTSLCSYLLMRRKQPAAT